MATAIRSSVANLFAEYHGLRVIAEPGRYFACSTHALAVNVISKRCKINGSNKVCVKLCILHSYVYLHQIHRCLIITLTMAHMDLLDMNILVYLLLKY